MSESATARTLSPFDEVVPDPPFIWAHRGASALAPENTLAAFALASELGADGIELDVQLSADGVPLVVNDPYLYHDGSSLHLRAPANARDPAVRVAVRDLDCATLTAAPLVFPDGQRARLERLETVLEALPATLWLNVELRAGRIYDARLAAVTARCLHVRRERCIVSSFDHVALAELHAAAPELPLAALCDARVADIDALLDPVPARMWTLRRPFITKEDVVALRERGVLVSIHGPEVRHDLAAVRTWPLAGIYLDDPRAAWRPDTPLPPDRSAFRLDESPA